MLQKSIHLERELAQAIKDSPEGDLELGMGPHLQDMDVECKTVAITTGFIIQ